MVGGQTSIHHLPAKDYLYMLGNGANYIAPLL